MTRIVVALCLACSVSTSVLALHLEGDATYRAAGRCFVPRAAAPLAPDEPVIFKLVTRRAKDRVRAVIDYDVPTGQCTVSLYQARLVDPVFVGVCPALPLIGSPFALQPVQDPRSRRELIPLIAADAYGYGGLNGYLVFPPGTLASGGADAIGFSARFTYTTTYVPPAPAAWPSRWILGRDGPSYERCVYAGMLRLGPVPVY
jgi:hypothetical protein